MKYFKLILVTLCFSILCACGASKSIKEQPDTTFESQATEKPSIDLDDNNEVSSES